MCRSASARACALLGASTGSGTAAHLAGELLKTKTGIIIPIGSVEQHGPNGLIGTDHLAGDNAGLLQPLAPIPEARFARDAQPGARNRVGPAPLGRGRKIEEGEVRPGVGFAVGLINGIGIALLRVQPLVMTLGTGLMTEGMLVVYTQKKIGEAPRVPQFIEDLGAGKSLGGIPNDLIVWVPIAIISSFTSKLTHYEYPFLPPLARRC